MGTTYVWILRDVCGSGDILRVFACEEDGRKAEQAYWAEGEDPDEAALNLKALEKFDLE